jgi:osmotically-inducible protein OsmY
MGFWLGYYLGRAASDLFASERDASARDPGDSYILPDERARQQACGQLAREPGLDAGEIEVRVLSGELTLTGRVPTEALKLRAQALCTNIAGVTNVRNELAVK